MYTVICTELYVLTFIMFIMEKGENPVTHILAFKLVGRKHCDVTRSFLLQPFQVLSLFILLFIQYAVSNSSMTYVLMSQ